MPYTHREVRQDDKEDKKRNAMATLRRCLAMTLFYTLHFLFENGAEHCFYFRGARQIHIAKWCRFEPSHHRTAQQVLTH